MKIFFDGHLIDADSAVIKPIDHGFLYGIGLFEILRVYQGEIPLLQRHYQRMARAAKEMGIEMTMSMEDWREGIQMTLKANQLYNACVRIDCSAGDVGTELYTGMFENPHWFIYAKPLPVFPEPLYRIGRKLVVLKTRRNMPEGEIRFKCHNYLNNHLAKREIAGLKNTEGLFLTRRNYLAETISSNLFFVYNQILYTPDIKTGIIPGTRRQFVMELARKHGMTVREGLYTMDDLMQADEVFLTNSIYEIVPVSSVNGKMVSDGTRGPVTGQLLTLYRKHIIG
jgi:4-amino-4-deoxychorismate lyase